jgi:hypothetical protein
LSSFCQMCRTIDMYWYVLSEQNACLLSSSSFWRRKMLENMNASGSRIATAYLFGSFSERGSKCSYQKGVFGTTILNIDHWMMIVHLLFILDLFVL